MTNKRTRAFALTMAILFFATSVGFSVLVVLQIRNENKQKSSLNPELDKALKEATEQQNNQTTDESPQEGKLENTTLANFTPVGQVDQLQIIDIVVGTGAEATIESKVVAHYTGALSKNGNIFESSKDSGQPATFPLNRVIVGWQQGVPGMKVGGTRRLIIPAALAYGEQGSAPKIGPNEPLVFDIELVDIIQ